MRKNCCRGVWVSSNIRPWDKDESSNSFIISLNTSNKLHLSTVIGSSPIWNRHHILCHQSILWLQNYYNNADAFLLRYCSECFWNFCLKYLIFTAYRTHIWAIPITFRQTGPAPGLSSDEFFVMPYLYFGLVLPLVTERFGLSGRRSTL